MVELPHVNDVPQAAAEAEALRVECESVPAIGARRCARARAIALMLAVILSSACSTSVPKPKGVATGAPYVSWVVMSGDSDNPDREFVCQSDPRNDCVVAASRPDAQVFSDVHLYYHGAGGETRYGGTIDIAFFEGSPASHTTPTKVVVRKGEPMTNQSVIGIVTRTPGTYQVTIGVTATVTETGKSQPIRQSVPVVVK
jgi:hypothetical protein